MEEERAAILTEARRVLRNPGLGETAVKVCGGILNLSDEEVCVFLPVTGVYVAVPADHDKRKKARHAR